MPTAETTEKQFLEDLFRQEYESLLRYAGAVLRKHGAAYVSDSERAEDVVQEVFSLAWEKRRELIASPAPEGWLYKTAAYKVREALREDRAWHKRLSGAAPEPEQSGEMRQMPEDWRPYMSQEDFDLLWKLYVGGYTYRSLCEELGVKKSALGMRIHRIKEQFQKNYKKI